MLTIRRAAERGQADHGWLHSQHTFSFAGYHDPKHMGFGPLRVINEDQINGGTGFGAHPHRDMEILSYVIEGALTHEDSLGNKAVILPGELQRMSAGTGVVHSERNDSAKAKAHFLQIWIMPAHIGSAPGYGQKSFVEPLATGKLVLAASKDGRDGSITIDQDVSLYLAKPKAAQSLQLSVEAGRSVWIQIVKGDVTVGGDMLHAGDGAAVTNSTSITLTAQADADLLVFDLPA